VNLLKCPFPSSLSWWKCKVVKLYTRSERVNVVVRTEYLNDIPSFDNPSLWNCQLNGGLYSSASLSSESQWSCLARCYLQPIMTVARVVFKNHILRLLGSHCSLCWLSNVESHCRRFRLPDQKWEGSASRPVNDNMVDARPLG
jgi:hypothetical protein